MVATKPSERRPNGQVWLVALLYCVMFLASSTPTESGFICDVAVVDLPIMARKPPFDLRLVAQSKGPSTNEREEILRELEELQESLDESAREAERRVQRMDRLDRAVSALRRNDCQVAVEVLQSLADEGYAQAQNDLGMLYNQGRCVPVDANMAFELVLLAAEQSNRMAQYNLGTFYFRGNGVEENWAESLRWFNAAADAGHLRSMYFAGYLLQVGRPIEPDYLQAYVWLTMAREGRELLSLPGQTMELLFSMHENAYDQLDDAERIEAIARIRRIHAEYPSLLEPR